MRTPMALALVVGLVAVALPARALPQEKSDGTVGWFMLGTGTVGITEGQTLRLSVVNLGARDVRVLCGLTQNPPLFQEEFTLQSGESKDCDLESSSVSKKLFDKTGRVQIRAFVKSSGPTVSSNVEVFDSHTGRTSVILPLRELGRRE